MSPAFEPERRKQDAKTRPAGGGAAPGAPQGDVRSRLKGLGYEEGRALLSPGGTDGADAGAAATAAAAPGTMLPVAATQALPGAVPAGDAGGVQAIPPEARRMVRTGSSGKEVAYAQERLNAHGAADPALAVDGIFGPLTRKACIGFQNSHALAADAVIGPKTWGSLDGPPQVGTSAGGGTGGGAGGPGGTMLYDNTAYPIVPPPAGTKRDVPIAEIDGKKGAKPPELGQTIKVEGAAVGTDTEVHLYWVIAKLGTRSRWGSEVDLVTQVGFPPKGGGAAAQGRVQLRIDGAGNATASLMGTGPAVVAATFADKPAAIAGLKATYGLKDVVDGDKAFTPEDLNKVHAAFQRLSAGERAALKGVVLKRVSALVEKGQAAAGLYSTEHKLSADGKTATSEAILSLADAAFAHDLTNFIGGTGDAAPISFQLILHEAGHAVEEAERYKAREAEYAASADVNRKVEVYNQENTATGQAMNEVNTATAAVAPTVNGYKGKVAQDAAGYVNATAAASGKLGDFGRTKTSAGNDKALADAQNAVQARDAQKADLQKKSASHPALTDLADLVSKQDALFQAAKKRATAQKAWDDAKAVEATAKTAVKATESGKNTKRLQNFKTFVTTQKIPELTAYSRTDIAEFYAEAFSLYRADPEYMQLVAPRLKGWFDAGNHLK